MKNVLIVILFLVSLGEFASAESRKKTIDIEFRSNEKTVTHHIDGYAKTLTTRASDRKPTKNRILKPDDYLWVSEQVSEIEAHATPNADCDSASVRFVIENAGNSKTFSVCRSGDEKSKTALDRLLKVLAIY